MRCTAHIKTVLGETNGYIGNTCGWICVNQYLEKNNLSLDAFDHVVFHQANKFILEKLYAKIGASDKGLISMKNTGNTVSSTIPFALEKILEEPCTAKCRNVLLCGFGVGLSWGLTSIII